MSILDVFQIKKIKAELEQTRQERDTLKSIIAETEKLSLFEITQAITDLEQKRDEAIRVLGEEQTRADRESQKIQASLAQQRKSLDQQIADLNRQIADKKKDLIIFDEEILLQSFGFYKPQYNLQNSDLYKTRLGQIQERQATMVKLGKAAVCSRAWAVNNNEKEGAKMVKDYTKLILRSFNNECDASISNVKASNLESTEKKIRKAFETLNKLTEKMSLAIVSEYLNLKLEELYLVYEYQLKKQEEREEQKRLREQMREEARLLKEIEEMKLKVEKEERHFDKALLAIQERISNAQSEAELSILQEEKAKIESHLIELDKVKQDVRNREQNTRAGYVYVISNMGAFGENIYKIGVTRRLDPQERVDELGDASVPFNFDVHAMIFSNDAPALENALHKAFDRHRVNMINGRREFFHVSLQEIEEVVRKNFSKPVEFAHFADATEYRQSILLRNTN